MRYSMLAYIAAMSRTLSEAAQYLLSSPESPARQELLENGVQMLSQIRSVLEGHREDLRSDALPAHLSRLEEGWSSTDPSLPQMLEQLIHRLPEEISYQVRAVFFAELGEKWDAMESVYAYMRDDPRFDPVIVRTPVGRAVERNGERKQEVLYKDFLTPMGIPSLGCEQYDIESDCPELAFLSQPYESCTPAQFWPEQIAKHARLVYLPYFLPDMAASASVESLTQLPVYRFAWRVPCATENQRRFYCRHAANQGANVLMTGIPKTDPFVLLKERPVSPPKSWGNLEGKTVFLWNSWYDLRFSSLRYFDTLLDWFKGHSDCVLIWRTHPMADTVTKLYYPDQYPVYQAMLEQAQAAENIVLDRESSCAAAFSASTAMISDYSSLLPQYLLLDKPALWIKSPAFQFTGEEFIDSRWMEQADTAEELAAFLERICTGKDRSASLRNTIRQRDLPLADGHCGERVCEALWAALHQEDL